MGMVQGANHGLQRGRVPAADAAVPAAPRYRNQACTLSAVLQGLEHGLRSGRVPAVDAAVPPGHRCLPQSGPKVPGESTVTLAGLRAGPNRTQTGQPCTSRGDAAGVCERPSWHCDTLLGLVAPLVGGLTAVHATGKARGDVSNEGKPPDAAGAWLQDVIADICKRMGNGMADFIPIEVSILQDPQGFLLGTVE